MDYDLAYTRNFPDHVFATDQGVVIYGAKRFLRAGLDGGLIEAVAYGTLPSGDSSYPGSIAQSPAGFGVMYGSRFCVEQTPTPDLGSCAVSPGVSSMATLVSWDGSAFRLYGALDQSTFFLASYDTTGAYLAQIPLPTSDWNPPFGTPFFLNDVAAFFGERSRDSTSCTSQYLDVFPRSLDLGKRQSWDLLPADFKPSDYAPEIGVGTSRAAVMYTGQCFKPEPDQPADLPACQNQQDYPRLVFATIVLEDGSPLEPRTQLPFWRTAPVVWDGSRFVFLKTETNGAADAIAVYALDGAGNLAVQNVLLNLEFTRGQGLDGVVGLAAIGDNDYVIIYILNWSGETWIARVSLVPI